MRKRITKSKLSAGERAERQVGRPSVRPMLLDAALDLIAERGVAELTYDALAERAGVSKGGLLYHFESKEALLEALAERLIERYAEARRKTKEGLPDTPSRELKGYAIASMHNRSKADRASARLRMSGLYDNRPGKAYYAQRFREISAELDFDRAAIVHLAVEGLWYMELAGVSPFSAMERRQIVLKLLSLADGGEIGGGAAAVSPRKRRGPKVSGS
jgi:AcrR family transcriptional regulator